MADIQYKIVYSKRRTLALMVNQNAELVVKCPKRMPVGFIEQFIRQKHDWITRNIQKQQKRKVVPSSFQEGDLFWFLGSKYPLIITNDYTSSIRFDEAFYISRHKLLYAKKYFEDWYKKQAKNILQDRLKFYSQVMGASYRLGKITAANTRWGSCSHRNTINFTWRLIMAPQEVVDYVAVHELAHTVHKDHSARFWSYVGQYCPNYLILRKWLKDNGHTLIV